MQSEGWAQAHCSDSLGLTCSSDQIVALLSFPGRLPFELCRLYVEQIILVSDEEIKAAVSTLFRAGLVAEPAGSAAFAALVNNKIPDLEGKKVVCILSGGNVGKDELANFPDWTNSKDFLHIKSRHELYFLISQLFHTVQTHFFLVVSFSLSGSKINPIKHLNKSDKFTASYCPTDFNLFEMRRKKEQMKTCCRRKSIYIWISPKTASRS